MPINPDAVGDSSEPVEVSWTSKDALLYAVGVGAGYPDPLDELPFTTENAHGISQQVLPTMAVVLTTGVRDAWHGLGTYDHTLLVHVGQGVELHREVPVEGTARMRSTIVGIHDKGTAAVVVTRTDAVDASTGDPLWTSTGTAFLRGEGGWGGDRGPSASKGAAPDRSPDHQVTYATKPDQALLYRLSGDRNPLHVDPWLAKEAGFDRPILHGLCTYGFTGRALLHELCGSDVTRFRSMDARFSKPVLPGDALTVSMWVDGNEAAFRTTVDDVVVIDGGRCTWR